MHSEFLKIYVVSLTYLIMCDFRND